MSLPAKIAAKGLAATVTVAALIFAQLLGVVVTVVPVLVEEWLPGGILIASPGGHHLRL